MSRVQARLNTLPWREIALLRTITHLTTLPKVWKDNVVTYKMFQSIGYGCLLKYLYYKLSYMLKYRDE